MGLFAWVVIAAACSRRFATGELSPIKTVEYIGSKVDHLFKPGGFLARNRCDAGAPECCLRLSGIGCGDYERLPPKVGLAQAWRLLLPVTAFLRLSMQRVNTRIFR